MPLLIGVVVVTAILFAALEARKRRQAMLALAARLGLSFRPERDDALVARFQFLNKLRQGSNRYAFNILEGTYHRQQVLAFDFHYETHAHSPKGGSRTEHHYLSCFILLLPLAFPELTIAREGFLSKLAQAVGYDDIDFESAEFSRAFVVRSKDKRFAYDVCTPKMIEFLLQNRDLTIELEGPAITLAFDRRLSPVGIERNLNRLLWVRALLPQYLFEKD
jgi:hypothetical protein